MFSYTGRMDREAGYLTIIVGTGGGAFENNNCSQGRAFDQFFQRSEVCLGFARGGGMLEAGIDSHILILKYFWRVFPYFFKFIFLALLKDKEEQQYYYCFFPL